MLSAPMTPHSTSGRMMGLTPPTLSPFNILSPYSISRPSSSFASPRVGLGNIIHANDTTVHPIGSGMLITPPLSPQPIRSNMMGTAVGMSLARDVASMSDVPQQRFTFASFGPSSYLLPPRSLPSSRSNSNNAAAGLFTSTNHMRETGTTSLFAFNSDGMGKRKAGSDTESINSDSVRMVDQEPPSAGLLPTHSRDSSGGQSLWRNQMDVSMDVTPLFDVCQPAQGSSLHSSLGHTPPNGTPVYRILTHNSNYVGTVGSILSESRSSSMQGHVALQQRLEHLYLQQRPEEPLVFAPSHATRLNRRHNNTNVSRDLFLDESINSTSSSSGSTHSDQSEEHFHPTPEVKSAKSRSASRRRQPNEPFMCDICLKTFTQKGGLTNHQRIHRNERPFACKEPGCTRAFAQKCNLTRHARCHTGEKPFACQLCDRAFNRRWGLVVHMKSHSGSTAVASGSTTPAAAITTPPTPRSVVSVSSSAVAAVPIPIAKQIASPLLPTPMTIAHLPLTPTSYRLNAPGSQTLLSLATSDCL